VFFNPFQYPFRVSQIALPNPQHAPTSAPQCPRYQRIPFFVPRQFPLPEGAIVRRLGRVFRTAMPETTIREDSQSCLPKYEIRFAEYRLMPSPAFDTMPAQ
jgi:hypothetical protein